MTDTWTAQTVEEVWTASEDPAFAFTLAINPTITSAGGGPPTGGAGGFLSGNYPNPGVNTEALQDAVGAMAGAGLSYDDVAGELNVTPSGGLWLLQDFRRLDDGAAATQGTNGDGSWDPMPVGTFGAGTISDRSLVPDGQAQECHVVDGAMQIRPSAWVSETVGRLAGVVALPPAGESLESGRVTVRCEGFYRGPSGDWGFAQPGSLADFHVEVASISGAVALEVELQFVDGDPVTIVRVEDSIETFVIDEVTLPGDVGRGTWALSWTAANVWTVWRDGVEVCSGAGHPDHVVADHVAVAALVSSPTLDDAAIVARVEWWAASAEGVPVVTAAARPGASAGGVSLSSATPADLGTASAGVATTAARGDHVHDMPTAADVGAAATGHDHSGVYSPVGHNHSGTYDPAGTAAALVDDLSGVSDASTARTNLGLGSAAVEAATAFARASSGLGGAGTFKQNAASVRDYRIPGFAVVVSTTTMTPSTNRTNFEPWEITSTQTFDRVGIEIATAAAAGKLIRMGVYNADSYWNLTTLVQDFGTVPADPGAVPAFQTITLSPTLTLNPGRYVAVWVADAGPLIRCTSAYQPAANALNTAGGSTGIRDWPATTGANVSALPSTAGAAQVVASAFAGTAARPYAIRMREVV